MDPRCPYCESPKIGFIDVDEIECGSCGKRVHLSKYISEAGPSFQKLLVSACPECRSQKGWNLNQKGTLECKKCGHTFPFPPHLRNAVLEALKPLRKKGTSRSQLEEREKQREVKVKERPVGHDFHWFVVDVVKAARYHGYMGMIAFQGFQNREDWIAHGVGNYNLDLKQLKRDWAACLRGDKTISEATSATRCLDKLLLDPPAICNKTEENSQALSAALKEEYPKEIEQYRRTKRTAIEITVEEAECCVNQSIAAQYLGYKNPRSIRRLRDEGKLSNCENHSGGKITVSSLIAHKNRIVSKK